MNRPVQVYLDEQDHRALEAWALERGWTKSHAVRVAVRAVTQRRSGDPLLDASGMVEGLPADASEHIDRYLSETYVAESAPQYRARARRKTTRVRR